MKKKILVVDHDDLERDSLKELLNSKGYAVTACSNGIDALEKLDTESFGLVVCALEMPGINGLDTVLSLRTTSQKLKRDNANESVPVIFTTTRGDLKSKQGAEKAAPIAVLTKPFDDAILLALAHEVFSRIPEPKQVKRDR